MPLNKKQMVRMIKIVAELKQNSYPNCSTLAAMFRQADLEDNINIGCNSRTVQRDFNALKRDFNAPIEFDAQLNGYYLDNSYWEFSCPLLCDKLITTSLLGARIAEDITPQPLRKMIRDSVDQQLTTNNSEFLDTAFMQSLIVASGIKADVQPDIFKAVLDGWRQHEAINFSYCKPDGSISERFFEPHIISFHKGIWYTKGNNLPAEKEAVYAIQRMSNVELSGKTFETDKAMINKVRREGLFNCKLPANTCRSSLNHEPSDFFTFGRLANFAVIIQRDVYVDDRLYGVGHL